MNIIIKPPKRKVPKGQRLHKNGGFVVVIFLGSLAVKFGIDWVEKKSPGAEEIAKGLEEGGDEETLQLLRLVALMNKILNELGCLFY